MLNDNNIVGQNCYFHYFSVGTNREAPVESNRNRERERERKRKEREMEREVEKKKEGAR